MAPADNVMIPMDRDVLAAIIATASPTHQPEAQPTNKPTPELATPQYAIEIPNPDGAWTYHTSDAALYGTYQERGFCALDQTFRDRFVHDCPSFSLFGFIGSLFLWCLMGLGILIAIFVVVGSIGIAYEKITGKKNPGSEESRDAGDAAERGQYNTVQDGQRVDNDETARTDAVDNVSQDNEPVAEEKDKTVAGSQTIRTSQSVIQSAPFDGVCPRHGHHRERQLSPGRDNLMWRTPNDDYYRPRTHSSLGNRAMSGVSEEPLKKESQDSAGDSDASWDVEVFEDGPVSDPTRSYGT